MADRPGTNSGQRPGTGSRPGTSGRPGAGSSGLAGGGQFRPGTGQHLNAPGSAAGLRPITSGRRTGTGTGTGGGLRTGQAVPSTPGQVAGYGVSLNTEVNVSDRPVTQQGMMGMRPATSGPGRQVQDASYYMGKLRTKITEISSEVDRIRKEIDQDAKDKSQYSQLERRYEQLAQEVRDLEGQLADYNLAMDKLRSATDPQEIRQVQSQLHNRNAKEAEEVDRIFILRQEQEKQVRDMDDEMTQIHLKHQDKINQLAPQKLKKYKELFAQNQQFESEIEMRSNELEMLLNAIQRKQSELSNDRFREEYDQLTVKYQKLHKEHKQLEEDAKTALMDPNDARNLLLTKVKDDKAKTEQVEKQIAFAQEENAELRKTLQELKNEVEERRGGGSDSADGTGGNASQKYELLFQRDKEMTAFMESFPQKKDAEMASQRQAQMMIVKLLEHISSGLSKEHKILPTNAANLDEMRSDLTFKERQLESAMSTKQRLSLELQKRQHELDKVNTLDTKIALELTSLVQKMDTMNNDMVEFAKVDDLKETHAQTKQFLLKMKTNYIRRRDAMKQQVIALSGQYEQLKNEIANSDTAKSLESLEQKLRHHEQNIFHLREYIDAKQREVNYEHIKADCLKTLQEFNTLRIQQQQNLDLGNSINRVRF